MSKNKNQTGPGRIWSNNIYALKTLFGPTPIYGIAIIVEAIRHNLINFLEQTICVFMILDAIENHKPYSRVIIVIALFLALDFLAAAISSLYEQRIKLKYLPIAQKALKNKLYEKAKAVDLENYDNPSYYNDYCMVVSEADNAISRAEQIVRMVFGSITSLLCYGTFFLTQDAVSVLFVVISFVLRTLFSNMKNRLRYDIRLKQVPLEKSRDYIKRLFYLKDYAKEIRLNKQITDDFHKRFDEVQDEMYNLYKSNAKKVFWLEMASQYLATGFLLDVVYVVYLIIRAAVFMAINFSQVVVLYNSANGLRRGLSTVSELGPYAVETSLYIEKIRRFLDSESKISNDKKYEIPTEPAVLECRNVSFAYDNNGKVLDNVNIRINPGEKIALVGYNGAGKSTLIKLILRFYEPNEGVILLDGKDIREYDLTEYRNYIGVIFQDFQVYATNIEKNVIMDSAEPENEGKVIESVIKSGLYDKILSLPSGLNTEITTEFTDEGTELSGGEEQKLAIARAFYKEAGIMLMDEPSSALDPIAEYELNCAMHKMSEKRDVIYISHRLSTTRQADRIYVMKNGSIVEEGTHSSLLKQNGIYSAMWNAQAMKYAV